MKPKKINLIFGVVLLIIIVLKMIGVLSTLKLTGIVDIAFIAAAIYLIFRGI
jgi:hypothetical protein